MRSKYREHARTEEEKEEDGYHRLDKGGALAMVAAPNHHIPWRPCHPQRRGLARSDLQDRQALLLERKSARVKRTHADRESLLITRPA